MNLAEIEPFRPEKGIVGQKAKKGASVALGQHRKRNLRLPSTKENKSGPSLLTLPNHRIR